MYYRTTTCKCRLASQSSIVLVLLLASLTLTQGCKTRAKNADSSTTSISSANSSASSDSSSSALTRAQASANNSSQDTASDTSLQALKSDSSFTGIPAAANAERGSAGEGGVNDSGQTESTDTSSSSAVAATSLPTIGSTSNTSAISNLASTTSSGTGTIASEQAFQGASVSYQPMTNKDFAILLQKPKVDANSLAVRQAAVTNLQVKNQLIPLLQFSSSGQADFVRIKICPGLIGAAACSSIDSNTNKQLLQSLIPGKQEISLVACVRAQNSLSQQEACGVGTILEYNQNQKIISIEYQNILSQLDNARIDLHNQAIILRQKLNFYVDFDSTKKICKAPSNLNDLVMLSSFLNQDFIELAMYYMVATKDQVPGSSMTAFSVNTLSEGTFLASSALKSFSVITVGVDLQQMSQRYPDSKVLNILLPLEQIIPNVNTVSTSITGTDTKTNSSAIPTKALSVGAIIYPDAKSLASLLQILFDMPMEDMCTDYIRRVWDFKELHTDLLASKEKIQTLLERLQTYSNP